jgi:hypothetical protein
MATEVDRVDFYGRMFGFHADIDEYPEPSDDDQTSMNVPEDAANVIVSLTTFGQHAPLFDLDGADPDAFLMALVVHGIRKHAVTIIPSTNHEAGHAYVAGAVDWERYALMLEALSALNLIDVKWAKHSLRRGYGVLRLPHIIKMPPSGTDGTDYEP